MGKTVAFYQNTMRNYIVLLSSSYLLAYGLPTVEEDGNEGNKVLGYNKNCSDVFNEHGMDFSSFNKGVAHGIHSLSLEEIRHFFKAEATEENGIPTVNTDFRAENSILYNAPLWGYNDRFATWSLKIMDFFMLNDKPYFYETMSNTVEKIAHQFHMQEIYSKAAVLYKEMLEESSLDNEFCSCANDIINNGVLVALADVGKFFKYRARTSRAKGGNGGCNIFLLQYGSYGCPAEKKQLAKRSADENDLNWLEEDYLNNTNKNTAWALHNARQWSPNTVKGRKEWINYSAMLYISRPSDVAIKDFATFLYCKLNQPNARPNDLY